MRLVHGAIVGSVLALPCTQLAAQDAAPLELAPSTPWAINYDADSCALQRNFGEGGQQVFFEIRRFGPDDTPQFLVASASVPLGSRDLDVTFVPIEPVPVENDAYTVEMDNGVPGRVFVRDLLVDNEQSDVLYGAFIADREDLTQTQRDRLLQARAMARRFRETRGNAREAAGRGYANAVQSADYRSVPRAVSRDYARSAGYRALLAEQAARVTGLLVDGGEGAPIYLRTGGLAAPLRAMDTCLDELMLHWGIDVEAHRNLTRAPEPQDFDRLAHEIISNYPPEMLRQRQQALVRVRLGVSPAGATTDCALQTEYSDDLFEQVVCAKMLELARFAPALDTAGNSIASFYQMAVMYRLTR